MDAAALLRQTLVPDQAVIADAQHKLEAAANADFRGYMATLANELANEQQQPDVRQGAAIAFKNGIQARDSANQPALSQRWLALDEASLAPLRHQVLSTLASPVGPVGSGAAQCAAAIAIVELPASRSDEILTNLLTFSSNDNVKLRVHSLQAIGYICDEIDPSVIANRSNQILTAVIQGSRKEEESVQVRQAALKALYNSLEFIRDNFDREGERNYIMQVVCEATQSDDDEVQVLAYQSLVRIMHLYYDKMMFYMERALFGLTLNGMRSDNERVALQAIEFWSTTCDEEISRIQEAKEAEEFGDTPTQVPHNFARTALPEIHPVLLHLLTVQEEDDGEDEWTRAMAAASCIALLAQDVGDDIIPAVVPFIEAGITRQEWQRREAAVMAFGSILDGPDPSALAPLVGQALDPLISMLSADSSPKVRDTVAWTLSRVTETMLEVVDPDTHLDKLVQALLESIQPGKDPRIITNCCAALSNLASQQDAQGAPTSSLSRYFQAVMINVLAITQQPNNDANARSAAFATTGTFISAAADDMLSSVAQIVHEMLARQEQLLGVQNQLVGIDDRNNWNDIQINICVVIQSAIQRSPESVAPFADRIMTNLLQLVSSSGKNAGIIEDAFAAIGSLASALEDKFAKYMDAFMPFLFTAFGSFEDWQLAQAAVFVSSDIARAVGEALAPHAERIMVSLIEVLRSSVIPRAVKPHAITAIGEIALAVGPAFAAYLDTTMGILSQAGQSVSQQTVDPQMGEFVMAMREAIIDAFIGILNGLRGSNPTPFLQYVNGIVEFVLACWDSEERTDQFLGSTLGLFGDIGDTYKRQVQQLFASEKIADMIRVGRSRHSSRSTRTNAQYAQKIINES